MAGTTNINADTASNGPASELAALLATVAGMADGEHGMAPWEGLAAVIRLPAIKVASGRTEFVALRRNPGDQAASRQLAAVLSERAATDEHFRVALRRWREQDQVQALERAIAAVASPRPAAAGGGAARPPGRRLGRLARRPVAWLAATASVTVASLIVVFFTPLLNRAGSHLGQPGQSVPASAGTPLAEVSHTPSGLGGSYAFPGKIILHGTQLRRLDGLLDNGGYRQVLANMGGYAANQLQVQLVLQNVTGYVVRIINVYAVKSCAASITGTLFSNAAQGFDPSLKLGFDLNSSNPVAKVAHVAFSATSPDYFDGGTVTVAPGGQQVFQMIAVVGNQSCSFRYKFVLLKGSKHVSELFGDGAQPFRVSAVSARPYAVAYIGGPASPTPGWDRVNPQYAP